MEGELGIRARTFTRTEFSMGCVLFPSEVDSVIA
jgi:hypothetical protein